jgi:hypothetical protein
VSTDEPTPDGEQPTPPVALKVVHGNPSPEELAALVTVIAAGSGGAPQPVPARSLWSSPRLRGGHHPGRGAWRASALPR